MSNILTEREEGKMSLDELITELIDERVKPLERKLEALASVEPQEEEPMLTIRELAKKLRVSETSLYRRAQEGKIPCFEFGGALRFYLSEVKAASRRSTLTDTVQETHTPQVRRA